MSEPPVPSSDRAFSQPLDVERVREALRKVGFLSKLKMGELEILLDGMRRRPVVQNTEVIRQGDTLADAFYIIARGRCTVWKLHGAVMAKIDELGPWSFFGERALITDDPRAATVKTEVFTELYVLDKEVFKATLLNNPSIRESIQEHITHYKA